MSENFFPLGRYIELFEKLNQNLETTKLLGISKNKKIIPSVANIHGVDLTKYQLLEENCFLCKLMSIGRDKKLPVGLYLEKELAIASPAYYVFKTNEKFLNNKYLMLLFEHPKTDSKLFQMSCGGVRGELSWEDFCKLEIPIPSLEMQEKIVRDYETLNR